MEQKKSCLQPVLLVIMDGVGWHAQPLAGATEQNQFLGDAVAATDMPNLHRLLDNAQTLSLKAHGTAVGLPSDKDMGNSEVGHNTLGCGRVFAQGATLVNEALKSGRLFKDAGWLYVMNNPGLQNETQTLHFCGLLSDGNVHSHHDHLFALISQAKKQGVRRVRLHVLLDGRDVVPDSAHLYIQRLAEFLKTVNDASFSCQVASGGGRTAVTMDRYGSDWSIVERGYLAHVLGEAPNRFPSLEKAIETFRAQGLNQDQNLPPFVIEDSNGFSTGAVEDGDSFVFFNFRGDRAIEFSQALTQEENFPFFSRHRLPKVRYAGMMQYDGDLKIPTHFLVSPPVIEHPMAQVVSQLGWRQFACSETHKFGHVTYFWNGNRSQAFAGENHVQVPSDLCPLEQRPWMQCAAIADVTLKEMESHSFELARINFANGDMVGHTGDFYATQVSLMAMDIQLGRLMEGCEKTGTALVITADHGNADEMYEREGKAVVYDAQTQKPRVKTSHSLAPVPFAVYNYRGPLKKNTQVREPGLANVAATLLTLSGAPVPEIYQPTLFYIEE